MGAMLSSSAFVGERLAPRMASKLSFLMFGSFFLSTYTMNARLRNRAVVAMKMVGPTLARSNGST
ncbi:hypothetical protein D3C77_643290 [compost metagenome]